MAPNRELDDALGGVEDEVAAAAAADPWREFSNARGARGGALPDIDEHGKIGGRRRAEGQRGVVEVVVVGQAASPSRLRALGDILGRCGLVSPKDRSSRWISFISLMEYARNHATHFSRSFYSHTWETLDTAPHVVKLPNAKSPRHRPPSPSTTATCANPPGFLSMPTSC